MNTNSATFTSFDGHQRIASGPLLDNALAVRRAEDRRADGPLLVFDDATGRVVDIDTRGSDADIVARLVALAPAADVPCTEAEPVVPAERRGRGRPRLGVVAREVTLLARHWEWLATQPGGASTTLRKLVEEARRVNSARDIQRHAQERAYHFMSAVAGDLPGFEEATRALFASDRPRMSELTAAWPSDVRAYALQLAFGDVEVSA